jgi:Protein of unknown function (DUF2808)
MAINMFNLSKNTKRFLSAIALSASLITGIQYITLAQGNAGLTLWSGVERENILNYRLDYGGKPNQWDRYRLRIPADKMENGASKFIITYPDYYDGVFDKDKIQVTFGEKYKKTAKIREIVWDKETQLLEIDMEEAIAPGNRVEIKLSNVKNPRFGGTYYFNAQVIGSDQLPVRLYVGTWIVSIER